MFACLAEMKTPHANKSTSDYFFRDEDAQTITFIERKMTTMARLNTKTSAKGDTV